MPMVIRRASAVISIHALREEGDGRKPCKTASTLNFYPRPPRGGRPVFRARYAAAIPISIHALREEGDFSSSTDPWKSVGFLSTPSARRVTDGFY